MKVPFSWLCAEVIRCETLRLEDMLIEGWVKTRGNRVRILDQAFKLDDPSKSTPAVYGLRATRGGFLVPVAKVRRWLAFVLT